MKNRIFLILIVCVLSLFPDNMFSQSGINTRNPASNTVLHIDGKKDNAKGQTFASKNDVVITSAGNIGIGTTDPKTRVDVRSSLRQDGIFAVGSTDQNALNAGAGAIRYNAITGTLEYSDGEKWHALPLKSPVKAMVLVNKISSQSLPNNSITTIINWSPVVDIGDDFNLSSGTFTAPRDGFYVVSFNISIDKGAVSDNSKIETLIESNNNIGNIQTFKSIDSFPGDEVGKVNTYIGSGCNAIFNLKKGNIIRFKVFHTLGKNASWPYDKSLYIGSGLDAGKFNNISIYEL